MSKWIRLKTWTLIFSFLIFFKEGWKWFVIQIGLFLNWYNRLELFFKLAKSSKKFFLIFDEIIYVRIKVSYLSFIIILFYISLIKFCYLPLGSLKWLCIYSTIQLLWVCTSFPSACRHHQVDVKRSAILFQKLSKASLRIPLRKDPKSVTVLQESIILFCPTPLVVLVGCRVLGNVQLTSYGNQQIKRIYGNIQFLQESLFQ